MSAGPSKPPGSVQVLQSRLAAWSKVEQIATGRLQRRVGTIVAGAFLDRIRDSEDQPLFLVKGGAAMELRFGNKARTSKDVDTIFRGNVKEAHRLISEVAGQSWNGFTGVASEPEEINVPGSKIKPIRFDFKLSYAGKAFMTVPIEISWQEGKAMATHDAVTVTALTELGLPVPDEISCLSVRYQIAQKLHACTETFEDASPNDRVRDLVDLILLEDLAVTDSDLPAIRDACIDVFSVRGKQPWPPELVEYPDWGGQWLAIVEEDAFPIGELVEAMDRVRLLIIRIDETEVPIRRTETNRMGGTGAIRRSPRTAR